MVALDVGAQQTGQPRRIGFLSMTPAPQTASVPYLDGLRQGLRERRWVEGQNLSIEYRWAAGQVDALPSLAGELLARNVEVIVTYGSLSSELTSKKLELLLDVAPTVKRIAILHNRNDPGPVLALKLAQEFAIRRHVRIDAVAVGAPEEFERARADIAQSRPDAIYVYPDPLTARFAKPTIELAAKLRLPAMYGFRQWPEAGSRSGNRVIGG